MASEKRSFLQNDTNCDIDVQKLINYINFVSELLISAK